MLFAAVLLDHGADALLQRVVGFEVAVLVPAVLRARPEERGVLAGAVEGQPGPAALGLDQPVPGGLILGPVGRALQLVFLGPGRLEHALDHIHVVQGSDVAAAGDGHLGAAQGHAGLHRGQGLQRLERGPGKDRGGDVAEFDHHGSVRGQHDSRADVAGLHEAAAFDDCQFDGGVDCEGCMRVQSHAASLWCPVLIPRLFHGHHHRLPAGGAVRDRIRPLVRLDLAGAVRGADLDVVRARAWRPSRGTTAAR